MITFFSKVKKIHVSWHTDVRHDLMLDKSQDMKCKALLEEKGVIKFCFFS